MSSEKECNDFGRRKGTIIIGDGTGYTNATGKAKELISIAKSKLGCKYVWGATGPNTFDCSGFTQWCYKKIGINIPRVSRGQGKAGKAVSKGSLQPGDLVFFSSKGANGTIDHVGMFIGSGEFIHSPHTGDVVKISKLSGSYYAKNYVTARRYL